MVCGLRVPQRHTDKYKQSSGMGSGDMMVSGWLILIANLMTLRST